MDQFLGKKYKQKSTDNYEEFLKHLGIGLIMRKTALSVSPIASLTRNDDGSYNFVMTTSVKDTKITFKLGEEFIEERADGVKVKSVVTVEGDDLIQTQVEDNGRKYLHIRKFTPTTLTVITTVDGWDGKSTRYFELVQ